MDQQNIAECHGCFKNKPRAQFSHPLYCKICYDSKSWQELGNNNEPFIDVNLENGPCCRD